MVDVRRVGRPPHLDRALHGRHQSSGGVLQRAVRLDPAGVRTGVRQLRALPARRRPRRGADGRTPRRHRAPGRSTSRATTPRTPCRWPWRTAAQVLRRRDGGRRPRAHGRGHRPRRRGHRYLAAGCAHRLRGARGGQRTRMVRGAEQRLRRDGHVLRERLRLGHARGERQPGVPVHDAREGRPRGRRDHGLRRTVALERLPHGRRHRRRRRPRHRRSGAPRWTRRWTRPTAGSRRSPTRAASRSR